MNDTIKQYNALIFPCQGDNGTASSTIKMEINGNFKAYFEEAMDWVRAFNDSYKSYNRIAEKKFRIQDGENAEGWTVYCKEEEIILSLLYACENHDVTIREICYRGDRYTNISDIRFWEGFADDKYPEYERAHTIQLHAKKNGRDTLIYIFGPCILWGFGDEEGVTIAFYPLSYGMVEAEEGKMYYAGTFCYDCHENINEDPEDIYDCYEKDEEDSEAYRYHRNQIYDYSNGVEVFLETDGENVTFSVLMDGKLHKKIRKDEEAVIFYSAIRDGVLLGKNHINDEESRYQRPSFWECKNLQDVIFWKNKEGEYRYMDTNQEVRERWFGISFVPPQMPDFGSLDQDCAHKLCQGYIDAFYAREFVPKEDCGEKEKEAGSEGQEIWKEKKEIVNVISMKKRLQEGLKAKVLGQDLAVEKFVQGFIRYQVRGKVPGKPAGVYLFAGPPGVGKTYLAEAFSQMEDVVGVGYQYKRFDMAAYSGGSDNVSGLVGFESTWKSAQPGRLTGFVRENPKCILLFDEIEKASPQVKLLFLSVLDGAVLEDKYHEEQVSFEDAILIFTTNEGKDFYEDNRTANLTALPDSAVMEGLEAADFAPELRSRLQSGTIVMFNHLDYYNMLILFKKTMDTVVGQINKNGFPFKYAYDDKLPALYLLGKGGKIDARFVTSNVRMMAEDYFVKVVEEINRQHSGKPEDLEKIFVSVEMNDEVRKYFERTEKSRILGYVGKDSRTYIGETVEVVRLDTGILPEKLRALDEIVVGKWAKDAKEFCSCLKECDWKSRSREDRYDAVLIDLGEKFQKENATEGYACLKAALEWKLDIPIIVVDRRDTEEKSFLVSLGTLDFVQGVPYKLQSPEENCQASGGCGNQEEAGIVLDREELEAILDRDHFVKMAEELFRKEKRISGDEVYRFDRASGKMEICFEDLCIKEATEENAEFRRQNRKYLLEEKPKVRLYEIYGNELAKAAVRRCIDNIRNPEKYRKAGAKLITGILMYGDPGVGKTMFAKAMAYESGVAFISAVGADFLNGDGVVKMEQMFQTARRKRPCILFIDEFDAISKSRFGRIESAQETVLEKFLKEMDGLGADNDGVYVVGATNYPLESLDDAVTRRFSTKIPFYYPNMEERQEFLIGLLKEKGLKDKISDRAVASLNLKMYQKMASYSEIKNFIEESIAAAVFQDKAVTEKYLFNRVHDETDGVARQEKNRYGHMATAFHEAGHAVLQNYFGMEVSYVTIVSRGNYGGYASAPRNPRTSQDFLDQICISFAGRAAEIIFCGPKAGVNIGAGSDLKRATQCAYYYVCRYGLGDRTMVVPDMFASELGGGPEAVLPESEKEAIWASVKQILAQQWEITVQLLRKMWHTVEDLACSLVYMQELSGEKVEQVIAEQRPYIEESCFLDSDNDYWEEKLADGTETMVPYGYPIYSPRLQSFLMTAQTEEDVEEEDVEEEEGRKYYYAVKAKMPLDVCEDLSVAFAEAYREGANCRRFKSAQAAREYLKMLELKVFRHGRDRFFGIYVDALAEQYSSRAQEKDLIVLNEKTISSYQQKAGGRPLALYLIEDMAEKYLDEHKDAYRVIQIYDEMLRKEFLYYMDFLEQYRRNNSGYER